jgi:hypothetical protein
MAKAPKTKIQIFKAHVSTNYLSYMPVKKRHRIFIWVAFCIFAIIIAGQLAYPADRGLPLASIPGKSLRLATHEQMAKAITDEFQAAKIKLTIGPDKSLEYSLKSAGAEPDTEEMIVTLSDYPFWLRLIPGTILRPSAGISTADVYYSTDQLKKFAEARASEFTFVPQNAQLAIKDGQLKMTEAMAGSSVKSSELLNTISLATITLGQTTAIDVPTKRTPAKLTSKDLGKVRTQAGAVLAHKVVVKADAQEFSPSKTELASWVILNTNDKGEVTLAIDKEKIKAYINELNKKVGTPAGQTNISIVDGRETGRTVGSMGRAINTDVVADQLASAMLVPPPAVSVVAPFMELQPSVIFNSKYTTTQAGLQAYVTDTAIAKNMYISIQQLDGAGWSAGARNNVSIPSGSTYKLFVALVLFDRIDKGEIHWDDPMLDTTVAGCFERMTVASTNPCAEKWIAEFGRQYINDFVHARGFSEGTSFTTGSANQTTANDLTKYMTGLNDGTLVGGSDRDRLLDSLGRHPYRYGIPTGSAGQVHDKVGFLWDYVHDTAIVNHPKGNYIMTIMTKGQSYAAIAAVTREVERIMYP